jgi:hypothetical protein
MSNSLTVEQLRSQLSALGVDNRGHRNELRARLKKRQQQQQYLQPQHSQQQSHNQQQYQQQNITIQRRVITGRVQGANGASQADSAASWRRSGAGDQRKALAASAPASPAPTPSINVTWKPIMDSYLVLDVEATCERGKLGQPRNASFEFPNESKY